MRKLTVGVVDIVGECPSNALYARVMHANLSSIMPQAVAYWCEQAGHDVRYLCYTGYENIVRELTEELDLIFISSYTESAQLAYALGNLFRSRGVITALGGPHARAYPFDAAKYFDYVIGLCDRHVIDDVLHDAAPHRPMGRHVGIARQPGSIPGIRERWKFVRQALAKSPTPVKVIPTIASLGCPYTCDFCIDATTDYQPLELDQIREDIKFVGANVKNPLVAFHDPNFGVRFDEFIEVLETAVPPKQVQYLAESSLSLLSEDHLERMGKVGFVVMLPGVESWYAYGNKSKTGKRVGHEKVQQVAEHFNQILEHIPYVQANMLLGTDEDQGPEPFALTKEFIRSAPGIFPALYMLTSFGQSAPLNHGLEQTGRVLPLPFHFMNNRYSSNVRPKHYTWIELYEHFIDLCKYAYSISSIVRRGLAAKVFVTRWMNLVRAISSEGLGRIRFHEAIVQQIQKDSEMRRFYDGESTKVPSFYLKILERDLGAFWEYLPPGAIEHDVNTHLFPLPIATRGNGAATSHLPVVASA